MINPIPNEECTYPAHTSLEDVIVVTNKLDYKVDARPVCVVYHVQCTDDQVLVFKDLIVQHWRDMACMPAIDSEDPIAGIKRGTSTSCLVSVLQEVLATCRTTACDRDLSVGQGFNPIHIRTRMDQRKPVYDFVLWGIIIWVAGNAIQHNRYPFNNDYACIAALRSRGVDI